MLANSVDICAQAWTTCPTIVSPFFQLLLSIIWPLNDLLESLCVPILSLLLMNKGHEKSGEKEF